MLASGLGNPQGFERGALRHGWRVEASFRFPDHHRFDRADADLLAAEVQRLGATLVITGKDAVKLAPLLAPEIPCWVLQAEAAVAEADRGVLEGLLDWVLDHSRTTIATEMTH
jgi:tetraacyldisaccharide-1-P 4'-kinase